MSKLTFSGSMQGILSYFVWLTLLFLAFVALGVEDFGSLNPIFILIIAVLPFILAYKTARFISDFQTNNLSEEKRVLFKRIRKMILFYIGTCILMALFISESDAYRYKSESDQILYILGAPLLISVFIVFLGPFLIRRMRANKRNTVTAYSQTYNASGPNVIYKKGSWFKDRVLAPVLVALIIAFITFLLTGQIGSAGGASLLSITINLMSAGIASR